ncbi:hypothetical protein POM88_044306 [Heracleum sosnowskyi]|uniref:Uncharacterized protein n=1 Tax=Heracleum sosnowskyi TaxID=360622 RepID=A0AAD8H567_9APIA|nr:hypothetical protein POM88_044306 [Heracleum sosnowskyi]
MNNQRKRMEIEVFEESLVIESLQMELKQANELRSLADKATSDGVDDISQLISDMEFSQLRLELKITKKEWEHFKCEVQTITDKYEKLKSEVNEIYKKESDAQLEIAKLKSELHREKSKTAVAESYEERAKRENLALELANQHLILKVEEAKCELQILKDFAYKGSEEPSEVIEIDGTIVGEQRNACISFSKKEFESLVKKAIESEVTNRKIDELKREIETTTTKMEEFRTRAEQAVWRAEVAEKAKASFEEEKSKWVQHEERRKVDFDAFKQESISSKNTPKIYMPLGKLLKMKF